MTASPSNTSVAPFGTTAAGDELAAVSHDGTKLLCPACGDSYVHWSFDHYERTNAYTCPLGTRGSWLALAFWCEGCENHWRLVVGFHKGETYVGTVEE